MNTMIPLLDLLFPRRCAGCSTAGAAWCPACAAGVGGLSAVHRSALRGGPPAYAVTPYAGPARRLVLAYKERRRRELATPIGLILAEAIPRVLVREFPDPPRRADGRAPGPGLQAGAVVLVPAPSRAAELRRRGGNHVELVAVRAAAELRARGVAVEVAGVLRLRRGTRDSVGLMPAARALNLRGRVRVRGRVPLPSGPVLLIDDVITTGATVAACASALRAAGVPVAAALALTATA